MNEATAKDPLALGLGSLGAGVGFGSAFMTTAEVALRLLQDQFERVGYYVLTAGFIATVGVAGAYAWYRSFPLDNVWQRGVIAMLAAVGAILIGFLAAPMDRFFGVPGMLIWLALSVAFGIVSGRWAMKGTGTS